MSVGKLHLADVTRHAVDLDRPPGRENFSAVSCSRRACWPAGSTIADSEAGTEPATIFLSLFVLHQPADLDVPHRLARLVEHFDLRRTRFVARNRRPAFQRLHRRAGKIQKSELRHMVRCGDTAEPDAPAVARKRNIQLRPVRLPRDARAASPAASPLSPRACRACLK